MERAEGIIIKKKEYREADLVYTVYTKEFGKTIFLAKGARKITAKLRSCLEPFNHVSLCFVCGKTTQIITEADVVRNFSRELSRNTSAFAHAFRFADLINARVEGQERDPGLWQFISRGFEVLSTECFSRPEKLQFFLPYSSLKMSKILGFSPELYNCVSCNARLKPEGGYRFRLRDGRVVCDKCPKADQDIELDERVLRLLRVFLEKDWVFVRRLKQPSRKDLLTLAKISHDLLFYFP